MKKVIYITVVRLLMTENVERNKTKFLWSSAVLVFIEILVETLSYVGSETGALNLILLYYLPVLGLRAGLIARLLQHKTFANLHFWGQISRTL
jgi:hypothetical protein